MSQFTLINDPAALNKLIARAVKSGAAFAALLHEAGFNCVMHVVNTGDVRPLQRLYDGIGPRARVALSVWAVKHCPKLKHDAKAGSFGVRKSDAGTDIDALQAIGPMDYIKPAKPRVAHAFDLKAEIAKLVERAEKYAPGASKPIGLLQQAAKAA